MEQQYPEQSSGWPHVQENVQQQGNRQYGSPRQPPGQQLQPGAGRRVQPPAPRRTPQARPVYALTAAQQFWYVLSCIAFGAGYFAKIPAKKAMADAGLCRLTGAESFWYVLMCIGFGAGYFAKLSTAKALSELPQWRPGAG